MSNEIKHSPAPWRRDNAHIVKESDNSIVCTMPRQTHERGNIVGENEARLRRANANLIAAAPDMLRVLLDVRSYADDADDSALLDDINEVIKKATGEI